MAKRKKTSKPKPNRKTKKSIEQSLYRLFLQESKKRRTEKKIKEQYKELKREFPKHRPRKKPSLEKQIYKDILKEAKIVPLTYKGKEISPEFEWYITNVAKSKKVTPQSLLSNRKYYKSFDKLLKNWKATLFRTSKQVTKFIKKIGKEKVTVTDGKKSKKVSPEQAIQKMILFEQQAKKKYDTVYLGIKTEQWVTGETKIFLPDDVDNDENIEAFLETDNVEYLIYN